jgi:hypothetical protein
MFSGLLGAATRSLLQKLFVHRGSLKRLAVGASPPVPVAFCFPLPL